MICSYADARAIELYMQMDPVLFSNEKRIDITIEINNESVYASSEERLNGAILNETFIF